MAEGLLHSFDKNLEVYSAGTQPANKVHPYAIQVMQEVGIDISNNQPKRVDEFLHQEFDYVITVCDGANESCPVFTGKVKHRLHIGFPDPAAATGTEEEIHNAFREVRNSIKTEFFKFYISIK